MPTDFTDPDNLGLKILNDRVKKRVEAQIEGERSKSMTENDRNWDLEPPVLHSRDYITPDKSLVVDAICGAGFGTMTFAIEMQKKGLAEFTGNQHNEAWEWDKGKLLMLAVPELQVLYDRIKQGVTR